MSDGEVSGPFVMDRDLQRSMLEQMREAYPDMVRGFPERRALTRAELTTLCYLREHDLCDANITLARPGHWAWSGARITAKGLDFLADDGGLGAILNVVTVKLHADTIRDMLAAKIDGSDLPVEKKSALKAAVGKLSGTAMTAATGDLVKMGLEHGPDAVHWIERLVSSLS